MTVNIHSRDRKRILHTVAAYLGFLAQLLRSVFPARFNREPRAEQNAFSAVEPSGGFVITTANIIFADLQKNKKSTECPAIAFYTNERKGTIPCIFE